MRYITLALAVLRFGSGLYLLLTALSRVLVPPQTSTIVSLYSMLGLAPVDQGIVRAIVTGALALLGLWLLVGHLMVVSGLLVLALGLVNGISELVGSQTLAGLATADRTALVNLGLRDLLVLAPVGLSLALLDAERRRRGTKRGPSVTMFSEERRRVGR